MTVYKNWLQSGAKLKIQKALKIIKAPKQKKIVK